MKCPHCAEEIKPDANKCKHCGEWLNASGGGAKGSSSARAVSKGLKQKEVDDSANGCMMFLAIVVSVVVGSYTHWLAGLVLFLVLAVAIAYWYYKE